MQKPGFESYHAAHVEFVSSNGTTVVEIVKTLLSISMTPLLSSLILPWAVPPSFTNHATKDIGFYMYIRSIVEYPVIVILPLWIITVMAGGDDNVGSSGWNDFVWTAIFCSCLGFMVVNYSITEPKWEGFQDFWNKIKDKPFSFEPIESHAVSKSKLNEEKGVKKADMKVKYPFITNYRAIVTYITILAILAVDFGIFPRRFAKTKKYGYSLMDIGTGCFIFSNGIVSPEAKDRRSNLRKSWKSSIPLFVLGFVRLLSVKGIQYHEVVEEYGVHWNFFFTLAAVKLLSAVVFSVLEPANALKLSSVIAILYEVCLVKTGIGEDYILNPSIPRNGLINANREGLFSVWGYFSLYLASVFVGKVIYSGRKNTIKDWITYGFQSGVHVLLLWISFFLSDYLGFAGCRRTANLSYILWVLATNYTVLWVLHFIGIVQVCGQYLGLLHGPMITHELKRLMEREEGKIKKMNEQVKKNKCYGASVKEVQVEKKLSVLEAKLKEFEQSGKASISGEVSALIQHIEEELKSIGEKLAEEDQEELNKQTKEEENESNLIWMPDLAKSPATLDAICYNGLGAFLLGNLLTGLINCLVDTIYVPDYMALCYLWAYATSVSVTCLVLYFYQIQLKFW